MKADAPDTLWELLQRAPGERRAIVAPDSGQQTTYDELRAQVGATADALTAFGVRRGDRVALALPNGLPAIVGFLAASIAGTAAPLNPGYRFDEFGFYLEDTSARLMILPPSGLDEARQAAAGRCPILSVDVGVDGRVRLEPGMPTGEGRDPGPAKAALRVESAATVGGGRPDPSDIALVLHTSGSTGRPKRVPLTQRNLIVSALSIATTYELGPTDVSLCVMPLFHVHGLVASVLATLASGGTVVVPARFNPLGFWRLIRDHDVTWYSAVPTIHQLLLARSGSGRPAGAERLRFIRSCSAALSPEIMQRMESVFGVPVLEAYGMTEAAHQMASNRLPPGSRRPGTVGAGTGVEISIMDPTGQHVAAGQPGEVVIKGPNVTSGYENNHEANASAFVDGWFRTGDLGILDEDGSLHLIGRIKELINRGGEKVAPAEVDAVLLAHPAVAEAVAFGVPHPTWGEEVVAAVVLREPTPEADLLRHCRARLAEYKCPKTIHIVSSIPRTATGKIQRRQVAATLAPSA